jgi:DNA topoisomerase VI subunit B
MVQAKLKREVFATSRLLEFCSPHELINQTGHPIDEWPLVILKELVDNAIDASEEADTRPVISVEIENGKIVVTDHGPGIGPKVVRSILDYNVRVSSREAYVSPTRGAQGNALKTILALPFALSIQGETVIESKGLAHHIVFAADPIRQQPKIEYHRGDSNVKTGTRITAPLPVSACSEPDEAKPRFLQIARGFAWLNPHLALDITWGGERTAWAPTNTDWEKWRPCDPTSAHWYDPNRLARLMAAYVAKELNSKLQPRMVREFVSEFRGFSGSMKQKAVLEDVQASRLSLREFFGDGNHDHARQLVEAMQKYSRPVAPKDLGLIGEDHLRKRFTEAGANEQTFKYKREFVAPGDGRVPQVVEMAFGYCPKGDKRQIVAGVNWSPGISNPFRKLGPYGESLDTYLSEQRAGNSGEPITLVIHLASPRVDFTDRGKTALALGAGDQGEWDEEEVENEKDEEGGDADQYS